MALPKVYTFKLTADQADNLLAMLKVGAYNATSPDVIGITEELYELIEEQKRAQFEAALEEDARRLAWALEPLKKGVSDEQ